MTPPALTLRDPERCPKCHNTSRVMESRLLATHRRRRRKCKACSHLWRTYESLINPEAVRIRPSA